MYVIIIIIILEIFFLYFICSKNTVVLVNSFLLFHNHHKAHAIMLKIGSNTSYSCQCYCDLPLNSPTVYNFMTDNM